MRIRRTLLILTVAATAAVAQDRMLESLRKGIVEEESKGNLNAAVQEYQTVLMRFNDAREAAATAVFRMAECYRKLGKNEQAVAGFQRVVREFPDQSKLAQRSRSILADTYHAAASEPPANKTQQQARQEYRQTLEEEVAFMERELNRGQHKVELGNLGPDALDKMRLDWTRAKRQLAAFDAGISQDPSVPARKLP